MHKAQGHKCQHKVHKIAQVEQTCIFAGKKKSKKKKSLNLSYDILQDLSKEGLVSSFDIGKTDWLDVESPTVLERKKDTVRKIIKLMNQ